MNKYKLLFALLLGSLFTQSCATHGSKHDELISKVIKPPPGSALIYIIRAPGAKGVAVSLPFVFNQEEIGRLWEDQYLYVFAKPMDMLLPAADGSIGRYKIEANKTYYIIYGYEKSASSLFMNPVDFFQERLHFKSLNNTEGKKLINSYNLSGEFRRVTIGAGIKLDTIDNSPLKEIKYEYVYESETNKGSVTVNGNNNLRNKAVNKIKEICNIKNIALSANTLASSKNASFTTLSEKLTNSALTMHFECIY